MIVYLFNPALGPPQTLAEPLTAVNKLFIDHLEKVLFLQINALKSYFHIGVNQLRAAAEIHDLQSWGDFCARQAEIAQTVQRKLLNDSRILSDLAIRFKTQMDDVTQNTLEDLLPKAA